MLTEQDQQISQNKFQIRGGLYLLTSLRLVKWDLAELSSNLAAKIQSAPRFFEYLPMVIDLTNFKAEHKLNFDQLKKLLANYKIIPIGIYGAGAKLQKQAIDSNLAVLSQSAGKNINFNVAQENNQSVKSTGKTKVINRSVRSGQQIYAKNADLVILGSVNHGAEVLADGNIHIYGGLSGRALAGAVGGVEAHIFCTEMQAELISIAGQYKISEQLRDHQLWGASVDVLLNTDGLLTINSLFG